MQITRRIFFYLTVSMILLFSSGMYGQGDPIEIPYSSGKKVIDGALDDWQGIPGISFRDTSLRFHSISGYRIETGFPGLDSSEIRLPASRNDVTVQFCWDVQHLYVAFLVQDGHLVCQWPGIPENPSIYLNDAVELYIDTHYDSKQKMDINDYQFIVDIQNQIACFRGSLYLFRETNLLVPKEHGQNLLIRSAASVYGSSDGDPDSANWYIVEISIPFATIGMDPVSGDTIRIDVANDDADFILDTLPDPENGLFTWAFNWTGQQDLGYPESWKPAVLTGSPGLLFRWTEKHQRYWIPFILLTFAFSTGIMLVLFLYYRKHRLLPKRVPPTQNRVIVLNPVGSTASSNESHNERTLRLATEFILRHGRGKLKSEEVASHIGLTLRNFQRITREELHCTPTNFIYSIKLNQAAEFLLQKKGNVSEAAYEFGFSDPGYFSKLFKKQFGVPPAVYHGSSSA